MKSWLIVIALFVIYQIVKVYRSYKKEGNLISSAGGIRKKYEVLFTLISDSGIRTKVFNELPLGLTFAVKKEGGDVERFEMVQTFEQLTINCEVDHNLTIKNYKWVFDEKMNQEEMYKKIESEINDI